MKIHKTLTGRNVWCISDTHFRHENTITKFIQRPFKDVNEMDETMFNNWNSTVCDDDVVLFLGDFVVGSAKFGMEKGDASKLIYDNLNGEKIFIRGNHDKGVKTIPYHDEPTMIIEYCGKTFMLSHHPIDVFSTDYLLHGHIHDSPHPIRENKKAFNCSVEDIGYKPINLEDIIKKLS